MKKHIGAAICVLSFLPLISSANIDIRAGANVRSEQNVGIRGIELKQKLWKQEIHDQRSEYQEKREAWKNAQESDKSKLRSDFQAAFVARFKWSLDTLSSFQERMQARLDEEAAAGVDTEKAQAQLDISVGYMADIEASIESLKSLLAEEVSEEGREAKKEEARKLFDKLKTDVQAAHQALREAFKELHVALKVETSTEDETDE